MKLFNDFNQYSNYKYNNEISSTKLPFELQLLRLEGKRKDLNRSRYEEYLKELSLIERLKYYIGFYFPSLYSLLSRVKAYI